MRYELKLWHYYVPGIVSAVLFGFWAVIGSQVFLYVAIVLGVGSIFTLIVFHFDIISQSIQEMVSEMNMDAHSRYNDSLKGLNEAQLIQAYQHLTFTLGIMPDFLRKRPKMVLIGPNKPVYLWFIIKFLKESDDIAPASIRNFPIRGREQEMARTFTEFLASRGVVTWVGGSRGYAWAPGVTRLDLAYGMGFTVDQIGIEQLGSEQEIFIATMTEETLEE